jgi:hypothetical protein
MCPWDRRDRGAMGTGRGRVRKAALKNNAVKRPKIN